MQVKGNKMANTDTKEFKSGFVTLIGRPNVGTAGISPFFITKRCNIYIFEDAPLHSTAIHIGYAIGR